jgi:hypothetical protein
LPCWLWKADCEQKSHIQHFKVGTTTIWFDNNHDIKNTKKKIRGSMLGDCSLFAGCGTSICSRSTRCRAVDQSWRAAL